MLRGPLGVRKVAAWSEPRSLADVKAAAAAHGVTVNDVLLAAVAGGFARYLDRLGNRPLPARLRVFVPVDLGADALGSATGSASCRCGCRSPSPTPGGDCAPSPR